MTRLIQHPKTELVLRWMLGLTFLYSSLPKIASPAIFAKIVYGYFLFPAAAINVIAIIIPYLELVTGIALLSGIYPRSAAFIILIMLTGFMAAISINLIRGVEFDCGCFSISERHRSSSSWPSLLPDVLLFAAGLQVLFYNGRRKWCVRQTGSILKNMYY